MTRFRALAMSYDMIRGLRPLHAVVRKNSSSLASQLERSATSVALNLGEGSRRTGKDRPHHFRIALGSADEVRCALHAAEAWSFLSSRDFAASLELIDQLMAMLWVLSGGRPKVPR